MDYNKKLTASELVLTPEGNLYHINLSDKDLSENIILVGDPSRVQNVASFFDKRIHSSSNREMVSCKGCFKGKEVTVLSTGMGVDNIDIVVTELDACANINLKTREIKPVHRTLNIIRLGTCGSLQKDISVNEYIASKYVIGIDGIMYFYKNKEGVLNREIADDFIQHMNWNESLPRPYAVECSNDLMVRIAFDMHKGITITAPGFYGPQGRNIRLDLADNTINDRLKNFSYNNIKTTNYEMETSSLYALGKNLGHNVLTICTVIANREKGEFAEDYHPAINRLIETVLNRL